MRLSRSMTTLAVGACAAVLCASTFAGLHAQQAPAPAAAGQGAAAPGGAGAGGRGGRGGVGPSIFAAADANKDGAVTREELKATLAKWYADADTAKAGSISQDQLVAALNAAMPINAGGGAGGGRAAGQNQTPRDADVQAMMAALPSTAPVKPARPRKVLVLGHAQGFVHSSIPLAAKTIEALGTKTGAWATTITYDAADINTENLKQYDAVFLDSTTGCFLDAPGDVAATNARRAALLAFVRGGKGLAGIHAATDSYHGPCPNDAPAAPRGGGAGAGRGAGFGTGTTLGPAMMTQAGKNSDAKLTAADMDALANSWFEKLDVEKTGRVNQTDFATRFAALMPAPAAGGGRGAAGGGRGAGGGAPAPVAQGPDTEKGSWPEFNTMIGGFFKWHWSDPQLITVKIDDAKSPLTAMFNGQEYDIHDETYTMSINSFSRKNVHVLTSIDYSKMSDEDKAKEANPRSDHDYALSWIRREGQGRVFYEAHGHSERNYAVTPLLAHVLAGVQYALGDLKADDSPSVK